MARSARSVGSTVSAEESAAALAIEAPGSYGLQARLRRLRETRELGILGAAVALFVALAIARPQTFFTEDNILRVAQQISLLSIIAVGMTFVFIAGEIDL